MANIITELKKDQQKVENQINAALEQAAAVKKVLLLTNSATQKDMEIARAFGNNTILREEKALGIKLELETLKNKYKGDIYTKAQIKALAKKYNMRFLKSEYFKGEVDLATIAAIRKFGEETGVETTTGNIQQNFFILAPEKSFTLKEVPHIHRKIVFTDPAIFYRIDDNNYRLIHQWGNDFTIWNRIEGIYFSSATARTLILITLSILIGFLCYTILKVGFDISKTHITVLSFFSGLCFLVGKLRCESLINSDLKYHDKKWNSSIVLRGDKEEIIEVQRRR